MNEISGAAWYQRQGDKCDLVLSWASGKLLCKLEVVAAERFSVCLHFMGENPISQDSMCGLPSLIHSTVLHLLYDSALKAPPKSLHTHISGTLPPTHRNTNTYFKKKKKKEKKVKAVVRPEGGGKDGSPGILTRLPIHRIPPRHLISRNVNRGNFNCHTSPWLWVRGKKKGPPPPHPRPTPSLSVFCPSLHFFICSCSGHFYLWVRAVRERITVTEPWKW